MGMHTHTRAAWIVEWMTKPAGLTGKFVFSRSAPSASTSTRELTVISSKRSP
jgi:hypothetical protein